MGRLGFSSLNDFRLIFWRLSFSFSLSIWLLDRLDFLLQIPSLSSSAILAYLSFFQNFLIQSKKFIAKCLLMIFLLSTMSIFNCSRWLVNWSTVNVAFPLSGRNVGVKINTLQSGNFSCMSDLKFRNLFNIPLEVEWYASFIPAWTMIWLRFFGVTEWYGDSNHQPSHQENF